MSEIDDQPHPSVPILRLGEAQYEHGDGRHGEALDHAECIERGIQLTPGSARGIQVIVKEIGRRRNLRDTCQRLTHHFYPQGWVVCRVIEISLAEGAVAAFQKSHDGNRMESLPKISDKFASL